MTSGRNAIILAAGTASRFVPLSAEYPKGLLEVRGEILIERQIRQLKDAGIDEITIVVGYKAELFNYLQDSFGVELVMNNDYYRYNNTSSVIRVIDRLQNTYICSSDNYFLKNVFCENPQQSYYSALYTAGETNEYCITVDQFDHITNVSVGGSHSWYMVGHVYFNKDFSEQFGKLLSQEYQKEETKNGYWEDVYIKHIQDLPRMRIRRYQEHEIEEFDSIDELRLFDKTYVENTRSSLVKMIAEKMKCRERDLYNFKRIKQKYDTLVFSFRKNEALYLYDGSNDTIEQL